MEFSTTKRNKVLIHTDAYYTAWKKLVTKNYTPYDTIYMKFQNRQN